MPRRLRAASLAAPPAARAQSGDNTALVAAGRQPFDELRYEEAVQTLSAALLRRGNTAAREVVIDELLALSYLALDREEEAEGAFRLMLAREPGHALEAGQAPRVRDFYQGVDGALGARRAPGLRPGPGGRAPSGPWPSITGRPRSTRPAWRSPSPRRSPTPTAAPRRSSWPTGRAPAGSSAGCAPRAAPGCSRPRSRPTRCGPGGGVLPRGRRPAGHRGGLARRLLCAAAGGGAAGRGGFPGVVGCGMNAAP